MRDLMEAIGGIISRIRGSTLIDEETLRGILRDLQRALIRADVDVKLVYELTKSIEEEFKEAKELPPGLTAKDYLIYLLYRKLTDLLGGDKEPDVEIKVKPYILMLVGTEGSGKTTTAGKLANFYIKRGLKVGLIETDTIRPGAFDQLRQLAERVKAMFFGGPGLGNAVNIAKVGLSRMIASKAELIIIDTAGRHRNEEELLNEVKEIYEAVKPNEVMLVVDATNGKQVGAQAEAFSKYVAVSSIFITKLDSTAKGGGALVSAVKTGARIKFIGNGEDIEDIEVFNPRRFVARLMGMGDVESLLERVKAMEEEEEVLEDIETGKFTLLTLMKQLEAMSKLGPLSRVLQMLPMGLMPQLKELNDDQLMNAQDRMRRWLSILRSMTKEELLNPNMLNASRIRRIAKGSGVTPRDVRELLRYYNEMSKMMSSLKKSQRRLGSLFKRFNINQGQ
ncbi:signal recognition particle protein Srp54 [Caldivirga sp. UBA161]|uniref:signal recognition particle protein Srp54 n=1 Tax=Caldivirga sp. UBA161 TaxID=1915569 RepID=UPI0025BCAEBB|nr:signal recognition particle protein Srp54 [Caldivirga sp. UBA161]